MIVAHSPTDQVHVIREAATRCMARLSLSRFDNASISAADAWIDSEEFRASWSAGSLSRAHEVASYLGEAIIRRHGGSWSFGYDTPCITINRNGQHRINPFTKVQKRATHGRENHLLGLVHLTEHLVKTPLLDPYVVRRNACEALAPVEAEVRAARSAMGRLRAFIGFPHPSSASNLAPGTRAWEAQLTSKPLAMRLRAELEALDPRHPSQHALEEVAFYTAQLRELRAIAESRDLSRGRGYIGYETWEMFKKRRP